MSDRTELMTKQQMMRKLRRKTFITDRDRLAYLEIKKKEERLRGAKKENKTLQMFDKLLGIENDP